jgi:hypothetical protein
MGESYQQSSSPSWDEAMHRAGARLRWIEELVDGPDQKRKVLRFGSETAAANAAVAQAWIAYAREMTAHQRGDSVSPGDQ